MANNLNRLLRENTLFACTIRVNFLILIPLGCTLKTIYIRDLIPKSKECPQDSKYYFCYKKLKKLPIGI